MHPLNATDIAL